MDERIQAWIEARIGWMSKCMHALMDGRMVGWLDRFKDWWLAGRMYNVQATSSVHISAFVGTVMRRVHVCVSVYGCASQYFSSHITTLSWCDLEMNVI